MAETANPLLQRPDAEQRPAGLGAARTLSTATLVDRVLLICALVRCPSWCSCRSTPPATG